MKLAIFRVFNESLASVYRDIDKSSYPEIWYENEKVRNGRELINLLARMAEYRSVIFMPARDIIRRYEHMLHLVNNPPITTDNSEDYEF